MRSWRSRDGRSASGDSIRSTSATSSGSNPITPAGMPSTARSGRRFAGAGLARWGRERRAPQRRLGSTGRCRNGPRNWRQPEMKVRFEPIGEEITCAGGETVLDAAFRQGYNLVYGCREGQCSACKCFLLEGEVALKRYSNFALSDSERANGYTLMCRAMPEQDLVVELLHYDSDNYRLEHTIRDGEDT